MCRNGMTRFFSREGVIVSLKTERALRESEERYRALFEGANDAILTIRDGRCVSFNNKALEIYRCTESELLGATPADFSPPMQPDGANSAEKALEKMTLAFSGMPQSFDWRHLRRDGTSFDAEVGLNRVEYQGKAELLVIVRDITERKRAEKALKVSEAEKSLILNSIMDIVLYLDPDMRILWTNREARQAAGMSPEALFGRHCWEVWHQRSTACHGCPVALARDTGEPHEAEIRTPDGRVWYLRGFPIKDDQGRVKGVVEFGLDITERKRAEEALRESEEKFTRAFRATPSALVISTLAEGRYIEVNESFERTTGYRRGEVIGRTSLELNIWETPEARTRFLQRIQEEGRVHDLEDTFRSKSGELLVGLLSAEIIEIGGEQCLLILANDITERKRMENEIRALNADLAAQAIELEAANRELEAFNFTISHDLRTPLTVVRGYTQVLLEMYGCRTDEPGAGYLREIGRAARKMEDLTTTLLDFSRLSRSAITRERVDLSGIAGIVALELKVNEPQRNATFTIADGIEAEGDAQLLRVMLENLIGNAWKYTDGKEEALIEFGTAEKEGSRALFVRDNGSGFDMAHADRLFRPFQRLPGAKDVSGNGIGLATVQRIIHRHGGRVWAEGDPGKGATFYFTLGPLHWD
jgi:PAS domain S-box-containing protein